ncbi:MAG TPA: MAC/perforin domain-containing protein, partial [Phormidium sp.]
MNININQTPDELPVALKTFKFPKALKVTSQGLEPVNRPGVKLKDPISKEDVEKESSISDSSEAYYTKWEKQAYKMLSRSVTASAKISIPWLFAAFDLGASYKNALKSFSQGEETELFMVAQRLVKGAKVILKLENIELTDNFLKSVDKVLKSVDKVDKSNGIADLRKVFQEYGYFVATTYILGGKIVAEETKIFSGKQDKTALADEFKSFVTADWDKGSVAVENNNQNRTSQSSAQTTAKYSMKIQGGKEGLFNNTT